MFLIRFQRLTQEFATQLQATGFRLQVFQCSHTLFQYRSSTPISFSVPGNGWWIRQATGLDSPVNRDIIPGLPRLQVCPVWPVKKHICSPAAVHGLCGCPSEHRHFRKQNILHREEKQILSMGLCHLELEISLTY